MTITARLLGSAIAALLLALPQVSAAAQVSVSMGPASFAPPNITITSGDTVMWVNSSGVAHTVTADNNSFESGVLQPGSSYVQAFTIPGTYTYHCALHAGMTGTITVVGQTNSLPTSETTGNNPTADALRAQAQALLEKIVQLQSQLGAGQSGQTVTTTGSATPPTVTVDSSSCPLIGRSLKRGSSGDDVTRLQQFLARDSAIYPEAQITGYYGALTEAAVQRWQVKFNIVSSGTPDTTGYGVVGPRTAAAIALVCSTMSTSGGGVSTVPGSTAASVGGFIQVTPIAGPAPLSVRVVATVNTVNSCAGATYTLDYGDGTVPAQIVVPSGNCQQLIQNLGHTYAYGGVYTITLSAGAHRTSATVTVTGAPAVVQGLPAQADSLSGTPTSGNAPLTVSFSGTINGAQSCAGGTYTLVFGDDQSVPLPFDASSCAPRSFSVSHQYAQAGTYDARLYRGGVGGVAAGGVIRITVSPQTSGFGAMSVTPNFQGDPLAVEAEFQGGCQTFSINWGDGSGPSSGNCSSGTMTRSHTYATVGSYTVTLTRGSQVDTAAVVIQ
ncbi:MAG: cupredoxin domain-containing protein [Candidatus Kaiserbacteria bacterium]|nr:MAG: cupredoxin domain-containing protein [Candidatus Kaiserbacteria bacterium]